MVNFFLDKGGYHLRKGKKIWKSMAAHNICPHRTWQAMKARWDKFLSKSLTKYKVTEEDLKAADQKIYGNTGNDSSMDDDTNRRPSVSTRTGAQRRAYTREEDVKIIKHLLQNRRPIEVKGREMWEVRYTFQLLVLTSQILKLKFSGDGKQQYCSWENLAESQGAIPQDLKEETHGKSIHV